MSCQYFPLQAAIGLLITLVKVYASSSMLNPDGFHFK